VKDGILSHKCITVCGSTACGKTHIAVDIASRYGGEIISADSRQVYRTLDIGSGKDLCEYEVNGHTIPYHCIDIAEPESVFTLYQYLNEFNRSCNDIITRGFLPVVAGGTGLYVEGALKEYDVPHAPENTELRERLMKCGKDELVGMLKKYPDICAKTDLSSIKRIVRSIEIAMERDSGVVRTSDREKLLPLESLVIGIYYEREVLHSRIRQRLLSRLEDGMIEEVEKLIARVPPERVRMFGMEYAHVAAYLWKEASYEEMVENLYQSICRLAKRQMTWFRGMERRGLAVHWAEGDDKDRIDMLVKNFMEK